MNKIDDLILSDLQKSLVDVLKQGAKRILHFAIENEVNEFIISKKHLKNE